MTYTQLTIEKATNDIREMLVAQLGEAGFEGFEESEEQLKAFIPKDMFNEKDIQELLKSHGLSDYSVSAIEQQNWNDQWEKSFEPVVIGDFCIIRADFHPVNTSVEYEIVITPKMSFGTGHHATTQLMVQQMQNIDLKDKKVLDFGTGTGILAILAEKLGAQDVLAIDNDEWSCENAQENIGRNNCSRVSIKFGSLDDVNASQYEVILANINRNILLQYMAALHDKAADNGVVLMSGLLVEDRAIIVESATNVGFKLLNEGEQNNWITLLFKK